MTAPITAKPNKEDSRRASSFAGLRHTALCGFFVHVDLSQLEQEIACLYQK
ncbi:MAG TPA: hypothetical protein VJ731_18435 [Terriglobales bacterium]|nr:hypothetical protein [Terriglobales bacterium]